MYLNTQNKSYLIKNVFIFKDHLFISVTIQDIRLPIDIRNVYTIYGEQHIAPAGGSAFHPVLPMRTTSYYNKIISSNLKRKKSLINHQRIYTHISLVLSFRSRYLVLFKVTGAS